MESSYSSELECLVCLDLIVEPVTTVCGFLEKFYFNIIFFKNSTIGHTFCKICLIRNLKTKLNCPMCREPILQNGENMKKNVLMENVIKSKYPKEYEEKLKAKKLAYEAEFTSNDPNSNSHFSFPAVKILDNFIWPGQIKKFTLENPIFYNTIRVASVNDRSLVLIPFEDFTNKICCLCELQNISFDDENHTTTFDLVGKIRFKTIAFQNMNLDTNNAGSPNIFISTGEIIKDSQVNDDQKKNDILNRLKDIDFINAEILQNTPYSILLNLTKKYGNLPKLNLNTIQNNNVDTNTKLFETISFYYLNVIKSNEKNHLYETTDILERITWIHEKFMNASNHLENQSLSLHFYDLNIPGQPKDHLLYMIFLIASFIILGVAYKMKLIHFN